MGLAAHLKTELQRQSFMTGVPFYAGKVKQGQVPPYAFLHTPTTTEEEYLDGAIVEAVTDVQLDVIHSGLDTAEALAESIKQHLRHYKGSQDGHTISQIVIDSDMADTWDTELGLYRWIVDLTISHSTP